jgi:transcriptional regulator with XRE-family HTH domain
MVGHEGHTGRADRCQACALQRWRQSHDLTQDEAARGIAGRTGGTSRRSYQRWERGEVAVPPRVLRLIQDEVEVLKCSKCGERFPAFAINGRFALGRKALAECPACWAK